MGRVIRGALRKSGGKTAGRDGDRSARRLMWLPRGSLSIHPSGRKCATINMKLRSPESRRGHKQRPLSTLALYLMMQPLNSVQFKNTAYSSLFLFGSMFISDVYGQLFLFFLDLDVSLKRTRLFFYETLVGNRALIKPTS